jgi:type IV conjugative transfer system coupling protein TraD
MPLSKFKEFTRGGQTTNHAWRMAFQAYKAVVKFTLILSAITYVLFLLYLSDSYQRYLVKEFLINDFWISCNIKHYYKRIQIMAIDGRVGTIAAGKFVNNPETLLAVKSIKIAAWQALIATIVSYGLIFSLVVAVFIIRSKKISNSIIIRGARFVEPNDLKRLIIKENMDSHLKLAGVPLIARSETQHILFTGTTGTGKSVALTELMDQVRSQPQKAIIYDSDGSCIARYYRAGKDLILNPLDQRSPLWNIWQECQDQADFEAFAESLMPAHLFSSDPFWIKSARLILAAAAFSMREQQPTTKKLLTLLLTDGLEDIKQQLKNTIAETLVSDKIEKTALSIKATLSTYCKVLAYLPDETGANKIFSIRSWLKDEQQQGWLFIATNKEKAPAMRSLMSAWLDLAVRSILSLPKDINRRIWFFMDELPSLYELPSLREVLAEGRKYGACFVATIQDLHQLRTIYGREATEALLSCFNTTVCFKTGSTESAIWAEHYFGCQEVLEMREGFSYGANDMRDGVTLNQEKRKNSVIISSEFAKLNNLEAYLKLPGNFPITKLKFNYQAKPDIAEPLVAREIQDMLIVSSNDNKNKVKNSSTVKQDQKVNNQVKEITVNHKNIESNRDNKPIENSFEF